MPGSAQRDQRGQVRRRCVERVDVQFGTAARGGRPGIGEVDERTRGEVVDDLDGGPFGHQPIDEM